MSIHLARRTSINHLLNKGMPPTLLMKLTGPSEIKPLIHYEYVSIEDVSKALQGL